MTSPSGAFEARMSYDGQHLEFTISGPDGLAIWNFPFTTLHKVLGFGIKELKRKLDRYSETCLNDEEETPTNLNLA